MSDRAVLYLWIALAGLGIALSLGTSRYALGDLRAVRGVSGNGRRIVARLGVFNETARFTIQAIFLVIGLASLSLPPAPRLPPGTPFKVRLVSELVKWGLVATSALLDMKSATTYAALRSLKRQAAEYAAHPHNRRKDDR